MISVFELLPSYFFRTPVFLRPAFCFLLAKLHCLILSPFLLALLSWTLVWWMESCYFYWTVTTCRACLLFRVAPDSGLGPRLVTFQDFVCFYRTEPPLPTAFIRALTWVFCRATGISLDPCNEGSVWLCVCWGLAWFLALVSQSTGISTRPVHTHTILKRYKSN